MHRVRDMIPIWRLERTLHDRKVAREQRVDSLFIERLILKTDDFATLTWPRPTHRAEYSRPMDDSGDDSRAFPGAPD